MQVTRNSQSKSVLAVSRGKSTRKFGNDLTNNIVSIIDICNYPSQLYQLFQSSSKFYEILIYNSLKNLKSLINSIQRLLIALNSEGDYFNMGLYLGRVLQEALGIKL